MNRTLSALLLSLSLFSTPLPAQPASPPLRLDVTRDLWISSVDREVLGNMGGAPRLKLKSYQEMSMLDIDPAPLRGRVIESAALVLRSAGQPRLARVTVSSLAADWGEGTGHNYQPVPGASSFRWRRHPDVPWAGPGSDFCSVVLGQGGSVWHSADASPPDPQGWQRLPVSPQILATRTAGLGYGFLLFDDTGSEWTRDGDRWTAHPFPNRFVFSREQNRESAPYFLVTLGVRDDRPPAAVTALRGDPADLPAGEAWLSWRTPADDGPAGTLGFHVTVNGQPASRYLVPHAGRPGDSVRMRLRDLLLPPGRPAAVEVRAVDAAGNIGPAARIDCPVSDRQPLPIPGQAPTLPTAGGPLPKLGAAEVAILDELDKVHPATGRLIPAQPEGYLAANHLWQAGPRRLTLQAARNEFAGFQVLLSGPAPDVRAELTFPDLPGVKTSFARLGLVPGAGGPWPDPLLAPADADTPPGQEARARTLHGDVHVGHTTPAGTHQGRLTLRSGRDEMTLDVTLKVWDFTLPDFLSFLPEMNCYGLPANERDYYRLAHEHRTVLNRVPYGHNGAVHDGFAPPWDGRRLDWTAWDRRFGPYFDGSAFADLPRKGVPIEGFYLPLHENWPAPMEGNYNEDYWADRAFPPSYRAAFIAVTRGFAEHFDQKGWHGTLFQGFLNNKNNYKARGWSRATSPWLLDEPAHFQDFWALRYFGTAFHEGVNQAHGKARMVFRADISRPMWQRDVLDGVLDYLVVSSSFRQYRRMVLDRKEANGEITLEYGGTNPPGSSNVQPAGWCLETWALGCDGVVPWQTVGNRDSWKQADELALFYPPPDGKSGPPRPSIRLKSYRRGQQDIEYLTLWQQVTKQPRWAVGQAVRESLGLAGVRQGTGFTGDEDAGRISYDRLRPQDLWKLRTRIGEALSAAHPPAQRRLVDLRTPLRDLARLTPPHTPTPATAPSPAAPPAPGPAGKPLVLQGKPAVQDAMLDPDRPDQALGGEPRGNAVRKAEKSSVFLARFDLDRLSLPPGARVAQATVSFFVWDPSSQGSTRVKVLPVATAWDEGQATWKSPARGRTWQGGAAFSPERDAAPADASVIVRPDEGGDTADPPIEYRVDVTALVRDWLSGKRPNYGLALVPVPDREVDEGHHTRFQIFASEHRDTRATPRLEVRWTADR